VIACASRQISMVAAAVTTLVTNAAKHEKGDKLSCEDEKTSNNDHNGVISMVELTAYIEKHLAHLNGGDQQLGLSDRWSRAAPRCLPGDIAERGGDAADVRYGSKADIAPSLGHVRSALQSGHTLFVTACPLSAKSDLMRRSKKVLLFDHLVGACEKRFGCDSGQDLTIGSNIGQKYNLRTESLRSYTRQDLEAIQAGHANIEHSDVRHESPNELCRSDPVPTERDHVDVLLRTKNTGHSVQHDGMIIGPNNGNSRSRTVHANDRGVRTRIRRARMGVSSTSPHRIRRRPYFLVRMPHRSVRSFCVLLAIRSTCDGGHRFCFISSLIRCNSDLDLAP
jgi:hypothetical protein